MSKTSKHTFFSLGIYRLLGHRRGWVFEVCWGQTISEKSIWLESLLPLTDAFEELFFFRWNYQMLANFQTNDSKNRSELILKSGWMAQGWQRLGNCGSLQHQVELEPTLIPLITQLRFSGGASWQFSLSNSFNTVQRKVGSSRCAGAITLERLL